MTLSLAAEHAALLAAFNALERGYDTSDDICSVIRDLIRDHRDAAIRDFLEIKHTIEQETLR